ncbi:MAG TPA: hypothetical protein VFU91_02870, partial [Sphingomicrobium sp.]|nr:hypothetical protein [Sphingomicrobium sp.]
MFSRQLLLSSVALVPLAAPSLAQTTQPQQTTAPSTAAQPVASQPDNSVPDVAGDYGDDEAPIVIQGSRARGSVIG